MGLGDNSRDAAELALRAVYGYTVGSEDLIEIGIKRSGVDGRAGWQSVFTDLSDLLSGGIPFVQVASRGGGDIYIGACTVVGGAPARGRGGAGVRGRAGALWVDLDCKAPGRDGPQYFEDVETALGVLDAVLERVGLPGTADVIVQSGWGVQGWIRLAEPVPARVASRWTRALIHEIKNGPECAGAMQIDRVWDVTRVLRFPGGGTWNWRGGENGESEVTVLRLPTPDSPGVELDKIAEALGSADEAEQAKFVEGVGSTFSGTGVLGGAGSGALLDMDAIFDRIPWDTILVPFGWKKVGGHGSLGAPGEMEVWLRPGKDPAGSGIGTGAGERSAVVYGDAPGVLVVHSDSAETGLPGWWETRSRGGREEGGARRANTRWWTFVRLWGARDGLAAHAEDETEKTMRASALDIALGSGTVEDWPEMIVAELRSDGDVAKRWIASYGDRSGERGIAFAEKW